MSEGKLRSNLKSHKRRELAENDVCFTARREKRLGSRNTPREASRRARQTFAHCVRFTSACRPRRRVAVFRSSRLRNRRRQRLALAAAASLTVGYLNVAQATTFNATWG